MPESKARPELLGMDQVSAGWLNKYVMHYRMPDGSVHDYESVSRKKADVYGANLVAETPDKPQSDAVCIVGMTAEGAFLMTREFRFPMNRDCVQFPAGLLEPGEDIVECASRELREETGYDISRNADGTPVMLRYFEQPAYSSLGMGDESIAMVFTQVEKVGEASPEPTEFIDVFELPREDVARFLKENRDPISIRVQLVLGMVVFNPFTKE